MCRPHVGVDSIETAARGGADALSLWVKFENLATQYGEIRHAQHRVCRPLSFGRVDGHALVTEHGELRNRRELWPVQVRISDRETWIAPPWPHTNPSTGTPDYGTNYLRWLTTTEQAQAWLPSIADMQANESSVEQPPEQPTSGVPKRYLGKPRPYAPMH